MAATTATARRISDVLRDAADYVAGLAYARIVRTDVHRALRQAAQESNLGQAALEVLAGYLQSKGTEGWLYSWSKARERDEVAADLRAAATQSSAVHT